MRMSNYTKLLSVVLILSSIIFISCSKTNDNPPAANPIQGLWVGTQLQANVPGDSLYYSLEIRKDSSMILTTELADGTTVYATGRWMLSGTEFIATVTGLGPASTSFFQRIQATYSQKQAWLFGGWVDADNSTGTFTTYRVSQ